MSENILIYSTEIKKESLNHFELFQTLNSTKFGAHSANKQCEDKEGNIIAVRCNCDKKTYHPVFNGRVHWEVIVSGRNFMVYVQKRLWILED